MSFKTGKSPRAVLLMAALGVFVSCCAAQATSSSAMLPDAPSATPVDAQAVSPKAKKYDKYIPAGERAVPFVVEDKMKFGLHDAISVSSLEVWTLAATYEQVINGTPNYGQTLDGYGQRLGAAALRDTSDTLLVDTVFAPLFHEDPRYYVVGARHGIVYRTLYAVTRPLITRTDSGQSAPNYALLAGDLSGTILTNAYYPAQNRGVEKTAVSFGRSLGAIALGNAFHEFAGDVLRDWRKRQHR